MNVAIKLISRIPPGPHNMPPAPEYAAQLINDGRVIATTRYQSSKGNAMIAARSLAERKRARVINDV